MNSDTFYESAITSHCSICPDQCNLIMLSIQPYRLVLVEKNTKISTDPSKIENNEIGNQVEEHHVEGSRSNQVDGEVSRRNRKVTLKPIVAN